MHSFLSHRNMPGRSPELDLGLGQILWGMGSHMSQKIDAKSPIHICSEGLLIGSGCHTLLILDPIWGVLHHPLQC